VQQISDTNVKEGKIYILFLSTRTINPQVNTFSVIGGSQGIFELNDKEQVLNVKFNELNTIEKLEKKLLNMK